MKKILTTTFLALSLCLSAQAKQNLEYLPTYEQWQDHTQSIMKFWLHADAKGVPEGNFPTWRCDDGTLRNQKKCKNENGNDIDWINGLTGYDFVRMQARQTFAYGALFNLTGDKEALRLHKAGVKFLLKNAMDKDGGFHSILVKGKPLNIAKDGISDERLARTTQDLSYALVGLAMNAYLTHDPEVIRIIQKTQKYIYDTYFDQKQNFMKWCLKDSEFNKSSQKELVALLDQLNAYMILTWRLLPENDKATWGKEIRKTVRSINRNFYNRKYNRFFGCTDNDTCFDYSKGRHLDNGQSVKAFWMEYLAALGLDDDKLENFSKKGMKSVLRAALKDDKSGWYEDLAKHDASWWVYAELDQAALTLALTDDYVLSDTIRPWLFKYTDKTYGELKHSGLKTHFWRNGFHSSEHALIGTILSNAIRYNHCEDDKQCKMKNRTKLYFAPVNMNDDSFTPYLYKGKIADIHNNGEIKEITFSKIKLPDEVLDD